MDTVIVYRLKAFFNGEKKTNSIIDPMFSKVETKVKVPQLVHAKANIRS